MKREIKFKAFDLTLNHWVIGYLVGDSIVDFLDFETIYENIVQNSIGEYIGKKDNNENEIYEGDIVTENLFWDVTKKNIVYFEVVFVNNGFKLRDKKGNIYEIGLKPIIVGNMFQNSDLLKI